MITEASNMPRRGSNIRHFSKNCMLPKKHLGKRSDKNTCDVRRIILNNILNETALQIIDKVPNRKLTCKLSSTPLPSVCKRRKLSLLRGHENITRRRDRDECLQSR